MSVIKEMPKSGRVVLAHPSREALALPHADYQGLDLLLNDLVPPSYVYIMDVDAIMKPAWGIRS